MKKNVVFFAVAFFSIFSAQAQNIKLDSDAKISTDVTEKQVKALVGFVRANGYSCQTVSAVTPFAFSEGWTVICNQWRYRFEVANNGGKFSVTSK